MRLIDSCITQLKAQGPARTYNESKEEEKKFGFRPRLRGSGSEFRVSSSGYRVLGFGIWVSGMGFRPRLQARAGAGGAPGLKFGVQSLVFRIYIGFKVWWLGFTVLGFNVWCLGCTVSGFGVIVKGLGVRVSGLRFTLYGFCGLVQGFRFCF